MPWRRRSSPARRSIGLPTSSRVVPTEETSTSSPRPACWTASRRAYSAIGERQMFPVHTVRMR